MEKTTILSFIRYRKVSENRNSYFYFSGISYLSIVQFDMCLFAMKVTKTYILIK